LTTFVQPGNELGSTDHFTQVEYAIVKVRDEQITYTKGSQVSNSNKRVKLSSLQVEACGGLWVVLRVAIAKQQGDAQTVDPEHTHPSSYCA
jgi:hypothetical protein